MKYEVILFYLKQEDSYGTLKGKSTEKRIEVTDLIKRNGDGVGKVKGRKLIETQIQMSV